MDQVTPLRHVSIVFFVAVTVVTETHTPPPPPLCVRLCWYSTAQMQGITNERLRLRAIAFTSSCERVCVSVRPHPRVNACDRVRLLV